MTILAPIIPAPTSSSTGGMTFLQLVNRLKVECGVSGPTLATVQNLTGEMDRLKQWINTAWLDIQASQEEWFFLRQGIVFNTTAGKMFYTPTECGTTSFGNWKRDSFRLSSVGANYGDEQLLNFVEYTTFRNLYEYANMRNVQARSVAITVDPAMSLGFGSTPDLTYVIAGEYYTAPIELSLDTDSPTIPPRYQMMIVYRAMMAYGGYESASEVYQRGQNEFNRLNNRLHIDQFPTFVSGPPLA